MNYADTEVPYTRSIEFKNFNPEREKVASQAKTIIWDEYSRFAGKDDDPYYPVNTAEDKEMFAQYKDMEAKEPMTVFGGRLGGYAYYDMHQTIDSALTAWSDEVAPLLKK